jgi:MscS family membrane protein
MMLSTLESLKIFMNELNSLISQVNSHILQVLIVILVSFIADYILRKTLGRLLLRLEKTKNKWDDAIVGAALKPLSFIIWIIGISFAAEIVQGSTKAVIFEAIDPIRRTSIIGAVAWFVMRLTNRIEQSFQKQDKTDKTTVDALSKLIRAAIIIITILALLQTLGFSVSGVLAFGGIGGIAIGFAAKDLLANFFGGLMIYLDRPFAIGDWIRSPDRNIEGTVEHIGWRLTRIRTFDKRPLYVPNGVFANIALENPQRMTNRRIYETIGVRYEDASKMEEIIRKVKDMLINHPEIDTEKTLIVNLVSFAPSSLDFFIYTFTKTTNWIFFHEVKQDIMLKVLTIINDEGAQTAYPTSTIHLPEANHLSK